MNLQTDFRVRGVQFLNTNATFFSSKNPKNFAKPNIRDMKTEKKTNSKK